MRPDYFAQLGPYNSVDDDGFGTVFYDRLAIYAQSTVPYNHFCARHVRMHIQAERKAVGLDGVVMELLKEARNWLYINAYCLTTLLNINIFPIVSCNLLLFHSLRCLI